MIPIKWIAAVGILAATGVFAAPPKTTTCDARTETRWVRTIEEQLWRSLPREHQRIAAQEFAWRTEWVEDLAGLGRRRVADQVGPLQFSLLDPAHQEMLVRGYSQHSAGEATPMVCFAPGTSQHVMDAFGEILYGLPHDDGLRYQSGGRWTTTATNGGGLSQGTPTTLTYSFVPDGTFVPTSFGISGNSNLVAYLNGIYGNPASWQAIYAQVFQRWSAVCGLTYVWESNDDGASLGSASGILGVRGDVRLAGIPIDGNSNVLAFNYFPNNGDMVLDTSDNFFFNTGSNSLRLRNVLAHEHGHGTGQAHVCPVNQTKLMEPIVSTTYDGPRHDDIRGAQRFYGDIYEPDNTPAAATNLGTLTSGVTLNLGDLPSPAVPNGATLSIDANGEVDWFRFSIATGMAVTATVTPIGGLYDDSAQACGGAFADCCSGNFTNSAAVQDLELRIYAGNGSTVLATAPAQPAGSAESIVTLQLLSSGDYYVRVAEVDFTSNQTQLYKLAITAIAIDCNQNGILDNCDLDCDAPGCSLPGCGQSIDCNQNGTPDECDVSLGIDGDCNANGVPDSCDIAGAVSFDCNASGVPDECELAGNDCDGNDIPDDCDVAELAQTITGPMDSGVCTNGPALFQVDAPDATAYQWFRNDVPLTESGRFAGVNTSDLVIDPVLPEDDLSTYHCVVDFGCLTVTTPFATADLAPSDVQLTLVTPAEQTGCSGAALLVLEVAVDDTSALTFQWSRDGVDLADSARINGANGPRLEIANPSSSDTGVYTCRVNNPCIPPETVIAVSSVVDLLDPEFLLQPGDVCAATADIAVFSAQVAEPAGLLFRWFEGDVQLVDGGRISGAWTTTLTLANVQPGDDGREFHLLAIVPDPPCIASSRTATLYAAAPGVCPTPCATPGDWDADGDVDLNDANQFVQCMAADVLLESDCVCANLNDLDFVVDLLDWAAFVQAFDGPQ